PKILFELSQVETRRAVQDLRHGVEPRLGTASTHPFAESNSAKSQYKVGLTRLHRGSPTTYGERVGLQTDKSV
ncbi:MAG: hypothetical protein J0H27_04890, partial [Xanthomonadales bacterium]|nr:hypothetical protein [Xanthomonadales bacterium]